jgi:hypothetical protein
MVAVIVGFFVAVGGVAFWSLKKTDAYDEAIAWANNHPEVVAALGEPIEAGWLTTGSISIDGSTGRADLEIPISGPDGAATLYVQAVKSAGEWEFEVLRVEVEDSGEVIDLLAHYRPPEEDGTQVLEAPAE